MKNLLLRIAVLALLTALTAGCYVQDPQPQIQPHQGPRPVQTQKG